MTFASNAAWVNVGIDHDTPEFAVEVHRSMVAVHGQESLPQCHGAAHHGRWGR